MLPITAAREALEPRRKDLVELLRAQLQSSTAPHYRDRDRGRLRERCERLVDAFLQSLNSNPALLAKYLRGIAGERIDEGVTLSELQLVLHLLETNCWRLCDLEIGARDDLVAALGQVSGVIGHAKDALAQVYLDAATRSREDLHELRTRLAELARGTDTALLAE